MSNRVIAQADLSHIASRLRELGDYIDTTNSNVVAVGRDVNDLRADLEELTADFHAPPRDPCTAGGDTSCKAAAGTRAKIRTLCGHSPYDERYIAGE